MSKHRLRTAKRMGC